MAVNWNLGVSVSKIRIRISSKSCLKYSRRQLMIFNLQLRTMISCLKCKTLITSIKKGNQGSSFKQWNQTTYWK
jgi:hypothetical protein